MAGLCFQVINFDRPPMQTSPTFTLEIRAFNKLKFHIPQLLVDPHSIWIRISILDGQKSLIMAHTHSLLAGIQYFESFIFVPVPAKINFWNVKSFIFASSSKFEQFQTIFWLFYVVLVGIPNHL
jgi:hypothetical protein